MSWKRDLKCVKAMYGYPRNEYYTMDEEVIHWLISEIDRLEKSNEELNNHAEDLSLFVVHKQ